MNPDENTLASLGMLPNELIKDEIAKYLSPYAITQLAGTARHMFSLFQKELGENRSRYNIFLTYVAYGKQDEADKFLKDMKKQSGDEITQDCLLVNNIPFTDYSGRTFHCTAYEYAYWAKDTHMCRMLEKHMDADTKAVMLAKCEKMELEGLTYTQDSQEFNSPHFDFTQLKEALKTYVDGCDGWYAARNWAAIDAAWLKVGLAQRDVPAHVVHEYCRPDRSFDPRPQFDEPSLPRISTFINFLTYNQEAWFPLAAADKSRLGFDFAIYRGFVRCGGARRLALAGGGAGVGRAGVCVDLAAVSHLDAVRSAELTQLREALVTAEPE
ncbi:MAG: hypothetical protein P4M12_06460, partial [Gammaproteobacteria bacterium]|nr:hypothetical protein [Gammaproteobacteria bacterium]